MALTPARAGLAVAAACAVIAVAYLPPHPEVRQRRVSVSGARARARTVLEARDRAIEEFTLIRRRDSLVAIVRERAGSTPFVAAASGVGPEVAEWFERRAAGLWSEVAPAAGDIALGVVVVRDTADPFGVGRRRPFVPEFEYYLPDALGTPACVTVVRLGAPGFIEDSAPRFERQRLWRTSALFGPCAFYAMFGRPRGIALWLMSGGLRLAQQFTSTPSAPVVEADGMWDMEFPVTRRGSIYLNQYRPDLFDLHGCIMGRRDRCGSLVADSGFSGMLQRSSGRTAVPGALVFGRGAWAAEPSWLLSDVVASFGREAFANFWQSPLPYDSAFAGAFGTDIEAFVEDWMRERFPPPPRGWVLPASSWLISVTTLVVLVGAGAVQAVTRRVV